MDLILDVAKIIASYDEDVWYKMTIIHNEFAEYAHHYVGIQEFISLFWKYRIGELETGYVYKVRTIFGLIHSFNDEPSGIYHNSVGWHNRNLPHRGYDRPAFIFKSGISHWYQNGKLHRDNDKPAIVYDKNPTKEQIEYQINDTGDRQAYLFRNDEYYRNGKEYFPSK
jgi:hypothetical protein